MTSYQPKIRLFLDQSDFKQGLEAALDSRAVHYLRNVLRLEPGAEITVFNGQQGSWRAEIKALGKKNGTVELVEQIEPQESVPDLWLLFAPIKRDRIDFLVEKATELGVAQMRPVITRRTVVERVKLERLNAHAIEAAEQCGRNHVPRVHEPERLESLLDGWDHNRRILYCDEMLAADAGGLAEQNLVPGPWAILIGPEGGFDAKEREILHAHPATHAISLGPRILRADTAALAAITYWQLKLGDW
ncbi:MAG: 16S rRNA (uracil(1498)-N(3))-methyltransferase [Sphingomonadales bacterium]|jgi:16S rRNA (uracil1498-N3)-methyltransferase